MRINKRDLWMTCLLIPIIAPMGAIYYWGLSHALMYIRLVALVFLIQDYILSKTRLNKYTFHVFAFLLLLLLSTAINNGNLEKYISNSLSIVLPVLWCKMSFKRGRGEVLLHILSFLLLFIAIANVFVYLISPNGIGAFETGELVVRMGLISNDNSITPYLIPGCFIVLLSLHMRHIDSFFSDAFVVILFMFPMFFVFTGVGIITSMICVMLLYSTKYFKLLRNLLNFRNLALGLLVLFIVFCVFRATNWISVFSVALGSSVTFTGRTNLWEYAIRLISEKPFLGYGIQESVYMPGYAYRTTPHNMYFQLLLWSGVVGILPILGIALSTLKSVMRRWKKNRGIQIISIGAIGTLVYYIFEVHTSAPVFWILLSYLNYYSCFLSNSDLASFLEN